MIGHIGVVISHTLASEVIIGALYASRNLLWAASIHTVLKWPALIPPPSLRGATNKAKSQCHKPKSSFHKPAGKDADGSHRNPRIHAIKVFEMSRELRPPHGSTIDLTIATHSVTDGKLEADAFSRLDP